MAESLAEARAQLNRQLANLKAYRAGMIQFPPPDFTALLTYSALLRDYTAALLVYSSRVRSEKKQY